MEETAMKKEGATPINNSRGTPQKVPAQKIPPPTTPVRVKKKTQQEKRTRQSGKNTEKPYISSSIGDMCRLMMRMACTENTLNMVEPPPVEFYDFWHKFKITPSKDRLPYHYVDTKKVSVPRIKMNTSSFDLFAKVQDSLASLHVVETGVEKKLDPNHNLAPRLSDLWRGVRTSMSGESFISSSTKVSEKQENVPMEGGWSEDEEEDFAQLLSESEDERESSNASMIGGVAPLGGQAGLHPSSAAVSAAGRGVGPEASAARSKGVTQAPSSAAESSYQDLDEHQKEIIAVDASILHMEIEEARIAMEHAIKGDLKDRDVIDHFMDNLDDSFLIDAVSYGLLPDSAFTTDFDYFNEDPIYREKERKEAEALLDLDKKGKKDKGKASRKSLVKREPSDTTLDVSEEESEESFATGLSQTRTAAAAPATKPEKDDYETCLVKQKKRIEDKIRAAAARRTAMGAYIVPPGELPLARTFGFGTPGPAAYYPNINCVKPGPVGVFLAKRWDKSIYDTLGPGPGAYNPSCNKCTAKMVDLHFAQRFENSETVGPGPGEYDVGKYTSAGKDKPHALILSRRPAAKIGCGGSKMQNVFGLNRFGKRSSPNPLILSRRIPIIKYPKIPGIYDPNAAKDTRVGILIKSRIPPIGEKDISPGFVALPPLSPGPGVPMGIRKFETLNADSPGPIYQLPTPESKPVSMTFKPFPDRGRESEPSPIQWGVKPGDQCIKMTKARAPDPFLHGSHNLTYGDINTPGPKYKIKDCTCKLGISMKGKYDFKTEGDSPGPIYSVGTSHYPIPPRPVFQHKWKEAKIIFDNRCPYEPKDVTARVAGGLMAGRWPQKKVPKTGPGFYDLFGYTTKGKCSKIPLSFKSRQSPFVFTAVSTHAEPKKLNCEDTQQQRSSCPEKI